MTLSISVVAGPAHDRFKPANQCLHGEDHKQQQPNLNRIAHDVSSMHKQVFEHRTQGKHGEKCQPGQRKNTNQQKYSKHEGVGPQSSLSFRHVALAGEFTSQGQRWNGKQKASGHHRNGRGYVIEKDIPIQTGEVLTVVSE